MTPLHTRYRIGMPSLLECPTLEDNVRLAQELGLSFIELNLDLPIFTPERLPAAKLRQLREDTGLFFTVHLPENLDFASCHPAIREGNVERCLELIDWAHEAGIERLNMHLHNGIYFTLPNEKVWIHERY
ncbi:MAG TPA: TIM barrel protein, partial [Bacilli bacterium]|nr:TIM barrel protein [Bacilli bacterium]